MKFNDLEDKMRVFEKNNDREVPPAHYIVARIDGRGFTKLTKEKHDFEKPFDTRFRDCMVETTKHLVNCGFQVVYGYTQSDEISLLLHVNEESFSRKHRKLISVLAGEASAKFTLLLGDHGVFDCRIIEFPNVPLVLEYFRWRAEDAHRNALQAHCYWMLRGQGKTASQATREINKLTVADKNEMLFQNGVNFNDLPSWQKRGIGFWWKTIQKEGFNPKTNETVLVNRTVLHSEMELPLRNDYETLIAGLIAASETPQ